MENEHNGFSDDELEETSRKKRNKSNQSVTKSSQSSVLSSPDDDELDSSLSKSDNEDEDESQKDESSYSLNEVLAKYSLNPKSLFGIETKIKENGLRVIYKPPLKLSLFDNVPPTINFVTHEDKCIINNLLDFLFVLYYNILNFY